MSSNFGESGMTMPSVSNCIKDVLCIKGSGNTVRSAAAKTLPTSTFLLRYSMLKCKGV